MIGHFSGFRNAVGHFPLKPVAAAITRYLTSLDSTLFQYHKFAKPITSTGSFSIKFDCVSGALSNNAVTLGGILIRINTDTEVRVWPDTVSGSATFNVPALGNKLKTIEAKMNIASTDVELLVNGVSQGVVAAGAVPNFSGSQYIGRFSSIYFSGTIADVVISGDGVPLTEFTLGNAPVDDLYTFGNELPTLTAFTEGVSVTDNTVTIVALNGWSSATVDTLYLEVGKTYAITISNYNSPTGIRCRDAAGVGATETITEDGIYHLTPKDTGFRIQAVAVEFNGSFDISVREITNYNEVQASYRIEYSKGTTFGAEKVVNGDFSTDSVWDKVEPVGTISEIVNGRAHLITDGQSSGLTQIITPSKAVRITFDYEAVSGALKVQLGAKVIVTLTETGSYSFVVTAAENTNGKLYLYRSSGAAEGYFDNVSAKEIQGNALIAVNTTENQPEKYILTAGGDWEGLRDAVTTNGVVVWDGTEPNFTTRGLGIDEPENKYIFSIEFTDAITDGEFKIDNNITDSPWVFASEGTLNWTSNYGAAVFAIQKRSAPVEATTIVSAKRLIEVA